MIMMNWGLVGCREYNEASSGHAESKGLWDSQVDIQQVVGPLGLKPEGRSGLERWTRKSGRPRVREQTHGSRRVCLENPADTTTEERCTILSVSLSSPTDDLLITKERISPYRGETWQAPP